MRTPTGTWLGSAVLGLSLAGCTIEGTRQRGDECLQDRECVAPLRCEVTPDGRSLCVTLTRLDAGAPIDAAVSDTGPASVDVPDVPDVPATLDVPAAPDVSVVVDVRPPVDVPVPPDVLIDVPSDSGALPFDGGSADARVDASTDVDRADAADEGAG